MDRNLIYTAAAFALFIVCPRMAGMLNVVCKNSDLPLMKTTLIASVISIPLTLAMVWIFSKFGLAMAFAFCILTDVACALILKEVSLKAGIETIVIALFVFLAVKAAPHIAETIIR
ncbi:MAG: hypothetical protein EOM06_06555 [Sphingobacteriia bacterium]|nr:hypothetical protein [Sphingobacteriia bacterium]